MGLSALSGRRREPEIMDEPGLDRDRHLAALRGIARINVFSRAPALLWPRLRQLAERHGPLRVLDLACGGGDVTNALARRARREGVPLTFVGCDMSPIAIELAQRDGAAEFFVSDVFDVPDEYDVYINSLFLHHLPDEQSIAFLRRMGRGRAFLLSDLRRTRWGYWLARWGTYFLTWSPVVLHDAPASVRGAYTLEEVRELMQQAGLSDARLERQWPQRYLISWEREPSSSAPA
ncbi:MAG: methyltransferase domain-containing protein [Planctomycetota bacterium]